MSKLLLLVVLFCSQTLEAQSIYARAGFKPMWKKKEKKIKFHGNRARLNFKTKMPGQRHKKIKRKLYIKTNAPYGIEMSLTDQKNGGYLSNGLETLGMQIEFNGMAIMNGQSFEVTNGPNEGVDSVGEMSFRPFRTDSMQAAGEYTTTYRVTIRAK